MHDARRHQHQYRARVLASRAHQLWPTGARLTIPPEPTKRSFSCGTPLDLELGHTATSRVRSELHHWPIGEREGGRKITCELCLSRSPSKSWQTHTYNLCTDWPRWRPFGYNSHQDACSLASLTVHESRCEGVASGEESVGQSVRPRPDLRSPRETNSKNQGRQSKLIPSIRNWKNSIRTLQQVQ